MKNRREKTVVIIYFIVVILHVAVGKRCKGGVKCIPLSDCKGLYSQVVQGNNLPLLRLLQGLHCGFKGLDIPKICCPSELLQITTQIKSVNTNDEATTNDPINTLRFSSVPTSLLPDTKTCGIKINERIVGGIEADLDDHPWMALLRYDTPDGPSFNCGGVLISSRYVLTAAHCIKAFPRDFILAQVRLGEWDTSKTVDCIRDDCAPPVQDIPVEEIIVHTGYILQDINQHNDIALLRLSRDAQFHDFVKPICLPLTTDLQRGTYEGYDMEVAGWGKTEIRNESSVKMKVRIPIVKNSDCAIVYEIVRREIVNSQICAGGFTGQDSCRGDSGGALMGQVANNWMAIGIVSYGPSPCGSLGWPGVYTHVGNYVNWIVSKMRP